MRNRFGQDHPNKETISLWFMRLILSQYIFKNCFQNSRSNDSVANIKVFYKSYDR